MSCLGPKYNPIPPREWTRYKPRCINNNTIIPELQMYKKANILQYKNNSTQITKKQRYGLLAQRNFTSWASQTQQNSFPNIQLLQRVNQKYIVAPQSSNIIDSNNITSYDILDCIKKKKEDAINLPTIGGGGDGPQPPPPPPDENPNYPILPPIVVDPGVPLYIIPDGGRLICNTIEDPCSGEILQKTRNQICYPTTCSDVPGPIRLLCWSGRLPTYYPRVKRTYATSGNKWPINEKLILRA
jgi:hypothetical protein